MKYTTACLEKVQQRQGQDQSLSTSAAIFLEMLTRMLAVFNIPADFSQDDVRYFDPNSGSKNGILQHCEIYKLSGILRGPEKTSYHQVGSYSINTW